MLTREQFQELLEQKLTYLLKAGEKGASEQSLVMRVLGFHTLFDFKLSFEISLLLDLDFVFNFDFDLNWSFPLSWSFSEHYGEVYEQATGRCGVYGISRYGIDYYCSCNYYGKARYDKHIYCIKGPEGIPISMEEELAMIESRPFVALITNTTFGQAVNNNKTVPIRTGKHAWAHHAAYRLTYTYTNHYGYGHNNPLPHSQTLEEGYYNYFSRGLSPEQVPRKLLDVSVRLVEAYYIAACWYDFNSYDIGRYYMERSPIRFPKDDPKQKTESDVPFYDYDRFDVARYDEYMRSDLILWIDLKEFSSARYDLALYDYHKYSIKMIPPGDAIQQVIDYYRLMINPIWVGVQWLKASENMIEGWFVNRARMAVDERMVEGLLPPEIAVTEKPRYVAFARELRYNQVTLGHATDEEIIAKYKRLGLREDLLRKIASLIRGRP
jgi:hypothetical protein